MGNRKQVRSDDLDAILLWEGEVGNQRIRETLGVQPVWASRLLADIALRVGEIAGRSTSHAPLRLKEQLSASVLQQALPVSDDDYLRLMVGADTPQNWIHDARHNLSMVQPRLFAMVSRAARTRTGLNVRYRSMSEPNGEIRVIYPHAVVRTGMRWHVRAWCKKRADFRDFTLGRMCDVIALDDPAPFSQADDAGWQAVSKLKIVAHPGLSQSRQEMIRSEYLLGENFKTIAVRECLVMYALQDLKVATDLQRQQPPEYLLALDEPDSVAVWL